MDASELDYQLNRMVAHHKDVWVMDSLLTYHPTFVKPDLRWDFFPKTYREPSRKVKIWTVFDERNFPLPITITYQQPGIYSISGRRTGIVAREPTIKTARPLRVLEELELRLAEDAHAFCILPHPGVMPRGYYEQRSN